MALSTDLIEQAELLARKEPSRPKQASLRRAVSTAYYAVFHLFIEQGTARLFPGSSNEVARRMARRAWGHGAMKEICQHFSRQQLPQKLATFIYPTQDPIPPTSAVMRQIALSFVALQEARHDADYDTELVFSRAEVFAYIASARQCMSDWSSLRDTDEARAFLAAMLLFKHLRA